MKDGPCGYCRGVRLVGWSGAGPILCPRCCEHNEDVFAVVTQAWREQRTRVVEFEAELTTLRESARWIPVEESIPRKLGNVEIWRKMKDGTLVPGVAFVIAGSGWWVDTSGGRWAPEEVTHWRRLSVPPEPQAVTEVPNG